MPSDDDWTKGYARNLTNRELAEILEFSSFYHEAKLACAAMREAAKRLREEPEPHFAVSPSPDLPPLKANAIAET